jgi:hypothetical protein
MSDQINVFTHYCAKIREDYALLSKDAQDDLIRMLSVVMQDAYARGLKDGVTYEREACLKDVEAEAEFPGEPAPELLAKMAANPVAAARTSVSLTKKGIAKRIQARPFNY